jgi:hypothetical protein
VSTLLQQPLPAAPLTQQQTSSIMGCSDALADLREALSRELSHNDDLIDSVLAAVLQQQAAYNVGKLLVWVMQPLQHLQAHYGSTSAVKALYQEGCLLLSKLSDVWEDRKISFGVVSALLQQLEESGGQPCRPCRLHAAQLPGPGRASQYSSNMLGCSPALAALPECLTGDPANRYQRSRFNQKFLTCYLIVI